VLEFVRRHAAAFAALLALLVLLPGLGYGLWDPWETHYAEVARRIAVDDDWVTLRWGNADSAPSDVGRQFHFFSKPALTFWLVAVSFKLFGVNEAAARLPIVLLAALGVAGTVFYLRRLVPPRAAVLSAVVLLGAPLYAMLGHHAMTDMPFAAPLAVGTLAFAAVLLDPGTDSRHAYVGYACFGLATLAKGLLGFLIPGAALLALLLVTAEGSVWRSTGEETAEEPLDLARRLLGPRAVLALAVAVVLPAIGLLFGGWRGPLVGWGLAAVLVVAIDLFVGPEPARRFSGITAAGLVLLAEVGLAAAALSGRPAGRTAVGVLAAGALIASVAVLVVQRAARPRSRLRDGAAGLAVIVAGVAAGLASLPHRDLPWVRWRVGLPALHEHLVWWSAAGVAAAAIGFALLAAGERWRRLRLSTGLPLFLAVCASWYVPVIAVHGQTFVREFFLVHHLGRATTGVGLDLTGLDIHEGTLGYYAQQFGYAIFPFLAVLPAALVAWVRGVRRPWLRPAEAGAAAPAEPEEAGVSGPLLVLVAVWAAVCYALFSVSQVKFHHYVLPAVPALAILVGVGIDRMLRAGVGRWEAAGLLLGGVLLFLAWRELWDDPHRFARLVSYRYTRRFPEFGWMRVVLGLGLALGLAGVLCGLVAAFRRSRRDAAAAPGFLERWGAAGVAGASLLGAAAVTLPLLHGHMPRLAHWIGQRDAFDVLDAQAAQEGDKLVSWANNWRGEVFYSRDRVIVVEPGDRRAEAKLRDILRRPGRTFFVTTDPGNPKRPDRPGGLMASVGAAVGRAAAAEHYRILTPEDAPFAAALYDGPAAGSFEPHLAALPEDRRAVPGGGERGEVVLREPSGAGRIVLLGYRFAAESLGAGEASTIELFFRCERPTTRDWEVFIHADAAPPGRRPRAANGDHGFTSGATATSSCRPGELLLDRWELEFGADAPARPYQIFVGLWHPPSGDRALVEPSSAAESPGAEGASIGDEHVNRVYLGDITVR
jgi:4-amino-4-deoxy-L-arabinose transferase-like glycosyltransferase